MSILLDVNFLHQVTQDALRRVAWEAAQREFLPQDTGALEDERVAVVVGLVARHSRQKGRFLLEMDQELAENLTESMNGGPLEEATELYLFAGEFLNMVGGNALTAINNHYRGLEYRMTPPAIFAGKGLEVLTPLVRSRAVWYRSKKGGARFDVGFEGV